MKTTDPPTYARYLGVDLHKDYVMIGGVNARQELVLPPRRVELDAWPKWAKAHLTKSDVVVVEATTNTWDFYDGVVELVGRVEVANAGKIGLIAQTRVKTDKHDVMKLAKLSAAGLIPEVWVPPVPVRELRSLLAHRRRLVKTQTMLRNRLHSVLHRHHLGLPDGSPFSAKNRGWLDTLAVTPTEKLHLKHDLATLEHLAPQIAEVEAEVERLSTTDPWAADITYLIQLPGLGVLTAMTLLAAIGDITRFESAKKLVGYSGLGGRVHDSGQTHRQGAITKQGRKDLRWVLVEAAWVAVDKSEHWKREFERLTQRMDKNTAIVAIAHKLLIVAWHVLTERAADHHADEKMVATKLMRWSWELTDEQRGGLTTRQFIRWQLMKLKLGDGLTHLKYGNMPRRIASVEEVLALKPDLQANT
jgi:transposase